MHIRIDPASREVLSAGYMPQATDPDVLEVPDSLAETLNQPGKKVYDPQSQTISITTLPEDLAAIKTEQLARLADSLDHAIPASVLIEAILKPEVPEPKARLARLLQRFAAKKQLVESAASPTLVRSITWDSTDQGVA